MILFTGAVFAAGPVSPEALGARARSAIRSPQNPMTAAQARFANILETFAGRMVSSEEGASVAAALADLEQAVAGLSQLSEKFGLILAAGEIMSRMHLPGVDAWVDEQVRVAGPRPEQACRGAAVPCRDWLQTVLLLQSQATPDLAREMLERTQVEVRRWPPGPERVVVSDFLRHAGQISRARRHIQMEPGYAPRWAISHLGVRGATVEGLSSAAASQIAFTQTPELHRTGVLDADIHLSLAITLGVWRNYLERLQSASLSDWIARGRDRVRELCERGDAVCPLEFAIWLTTLDEFKHLELFLETRELWWQAIQASHFADSPVGPEAEVLLGLTEQLVRQMETALGRRPGLSDRIRARGALGEKVSAYGLLRDLALAAALPSLSADDPSRYDLLVRRDRAELILGCVETETAPFRCDRDDFVEEAQHQAEARNRQWLRSLGYYSAHAVSFAAGFGVSGVVTRGVMRSPLVRRWVDRALLGSGPQTAVRRGPMLAVLSTEAVIDVTVFTVVYKASVAALTEDPFWNPEGNVVSNLLLPVFVGSLTKMVLPSVFFASRGWLLQGDGRRRQVHSFLERSLTQGSAAFTQKAATDFVTARAAVKTGQKTGMKLARRNLQSWLHALVQRFAGTSAGYQSLAVQSLAVRLGPRAAQAVASRGAAASVTHPDQEELIDSSGDDFFR